MEENKKDIFTRMAEEWPGPGFARTQTERFTGGALNRKTAANLASLGIGPPVMKMRGKAYYDKWEFVAWFRRYCNEKGGRN